ncbi:MAG: GNAT family N-acetyltransferase, partial [Acidimicrobiia bacterium]
VGPSGDEDHNDDGISQVFSIHVDPSRWGGGIGKRLLHHALGFLQSCGSKEATLWVVAGNDRARQFYETLGWHLDGLQRKEILAVEGPDGDEVDVVRYRLELNAQDEQ